MRAVGALWEPASAMAFVVHSAAPSWARTLVPLRDLLIALIVLGKYFFVQTKFVTGEVAPDFELVLESNETINLSTLKGKYFLLKDSYKVNFFKGGSLFFVGC